MTSDPQQPPRIIVDEDWKSQVEAEREQLRRKEHPDAVPERDPAGAAPERPPAAAAGPSRLPPASFETLVETLAMQAMASLHELAAPPQEGEQSADKADEKAFHLEMAKHLIDTLSVLEDKTRGNLSADEAGQLEHVMHDLRLAFVNLRTRVAKS